MRTLNAKVTLGLIALSLIVLAIFHEVSDFANGTSGPQVQVSIPNGASGVSIGDILQAEKVIKSSKYFVDFYKNNRDAQAIAPGIHKVQTHLSTKMAVTELLDQNRISNAITVKEGSTFSDVWQSLKSNSAVDLTNIKNATFQIPLANRLKSLEGQLYPAIYSFESGTSAQKAIQIMLDKFSQVSNGGELKPFGRFSKYEVLTIASMIQVEGDSQDFPKVARVIYNRLDAKMPLQLNSTVQYAAGLRGRIALSKASTNIASPYNTYRNLGLPPTPISNPSSAAISAAQNPTKGDWLYFITVKPGDTRFTKSFTEFENWNTLYNNNLANGLFK